MDTSLIIAIGSIAISIVNGYFIWKLYKLMGNVTKEVHSHFSQLDLDNKLSNFLNDAATNRSIDELTKMVFDNLKEKFGLSGNSYSELIDEIKLHSNMSRELKELLVEFFNEVIRISYREENITDKEKEELKRKVKILLQSLQDI